MARRAPPADPLADLDSADRARTAGRRAGARRRSGAAPSASSATTSCGYIERLPHRAAARVADVPDALFVFTRRAGHHRQPRGRRRASWSACRSTTDASDADAARGVRRTRCARSTRRSRDCARPATPRAARSRAVGAAGRRARRATRASKFIARRRAHPRVHPRGRRLPGAARAAHRRAARLLARRRSIARCGRSIRRRTCTTSCSTVSSSSAARRSCSCASSGGRVTVRPIAGTRPRGATPEEDEALVAELLADEKERAEHVMLVDLGRNDVGRIAKYGTVRGHRPDGRRALLARAPHREPGRGRAARRPDGDGRVPRDLPRRHDDRRAEGARDGDHRRAGAGAPRAVRGRDRLHRARATSGWTSRSRFARA